MNNRSRVPLSLLVIIALQSCEYPMTARSERAGLRSEIALVRSGQATTEILTLLGQKTTRPAPAHVYSIAPNFGEYVVAKFDGSDLRFSFANQLPGAELYRAYPGSHDKNGPRAQIRWTSPHGSSLLLFDRYEGTLRHVCVCGVAPRSRVIATNVLAFTATDTHVYVAHRGAVTRLAFLNPTVSEVIASLPDVDEHTVIAANQAEVLIATQQKAGIGSERPKFHKVDIISRRIAVVESPFRGYLYEIVPLKSNRSFVTVMWDGDENMDGSQLDKWYIWDPSSGRSTLLLRNYKGYSLHQLPGNIFQAQCPCEPPPTSLPERGG